MPDFYSDRSNVLGGELLTSGAAWRSAAIPRQFTMFSYVYNVNANGDYVPNTTERTCFAFGIDDVNSTSLATANSIGYTNTLADFATSTGTDGSIVTSVQGKGGNFSATKDVSALLLGFSVILAQPPRTEATVDSTTNKSVTWGSASATAVGITTALVSREEQLFRQAMRNAVAIAIPNGNNTGCGARLGKCLLFPPGAGQHSDGIPQVGLGYRQARFALRIPLPYEGSPDPQVNNNRIQLKFGTVPGATTSQQSVVFKAAGDPALTENTSVVLDMMLIADVAYIEPRPGKVKITHPDGSVEERIGHIPISAADRDLMEAYGCLR